MISIPRATSNSTQQRRYNHLQQASSNPAANYSLDIPRGWALDLPSASAIELLQQFDDSTGLAADFLPPNDTMQSEVWGAALPQFTPKMGRVGNHQRESSLSSLGSAGPASPFNPSTSNPHIAVTADFGHDGLDLQHTDATSNNNYIVKSLSQYPGYHNIEAAMPEMAYPVAIPGPGNNNNNHRTDRGLLPAPDFGNSSSRSQPHSVASSVGGDSPATPTVHDPEAMDKRRKVATYTNVPKLDRTMTDIYGDELYNPNFAITSSSPAQSQLAMSPVSDVFSQRINAANSQHLSARQSPIMTNNTRERSPFRTTSPLATVSHDFGVPRSAPQGLQFNTAQRLREHSQAQQEAQLQHQLNVSREPDTPKTISPKDAIIEFPDTDENRNFPLFGTEGSDMVDQFAKVMMPQPMAQAPSAPNNNHFNYMVPQMQANGLQIPQQYPFVAQPSNDSTPRLSSAGSSMGSGSSTPIVRQRPMGTAADSGTYTCTYHGCTLRFETPALLQKHKREGHRQAQGLGARPLDTGMTSSLIGSQAGPHRCGRINPSTGKPCNTVFSRPYDLTRHEDTIHNARKQKVSCDLCTEEKTFSRADALTRHFRVCHPEVEVPGKRRRG